MKSIVYQLTIVGPINEMVPSLRWYFFTAVLHRVGTARFCYMMQIIHHNFHKTNSCY